MPSSITDKPDPREADQQHRPAMRVGYSGRPTGITVCSPQLHLYVRTLRAEVGSTNEYSSDVPLPHAWHFGGWLLSESPSDVAMRHDVPNSTFLVGTVSDISRAPKRVTGECRDLALAVGPIILFDREDSLQAPALAFPSATFP